MQKFKVSRKEHGMGLLSFLKEVFPEAPSVKAIKRAIDSKRCRINGRIETFSTFRLQVGDEVSIELISQEKPDKLQCLYEDAALWILNKPVGLVCEQKSVPFLLVHRLDKETSGLLLLAKTPAVQEKLKALFAARAIQKSYLALVDGVVKHEERLMVSHLEKKAILSNQNIWGSGKNGLEAITRWKRLAIGKEASLLECLPETGRTHQIRVHCSEMGHPILGDTQYGKRFRCPLHVHRHLLHAWKLSFTHPLTHKPFTITAPLPQDFLQAMKALGIPIEAFSNQRE